MALVNAYATVAQLRTQLRDSADNLLDTGLLERALNSTSRAIDDFAGRRFWQDPTVVARKYRPRDELGVFVDDISTNTGLIVKTDTTGDGTFATTWAADDYQLEPLNAAADSEPWWHLSAVDERTFPVHPRRATLEITARFGWAAVPVKVEEACLLKAARLFLRKDTPAGFAGFSDFGPVRISRFEDPDVADMLTPFARITKPET